MKNLSLVAAIAASLMISTAAIALDLGTHNTNTAVAGAAASARQSVDVSNRNTNRNSNSNHNSARQKQSQGQSNTIEGDVNPRQAPGFAAPSLAASNEACMGSTSTGAGVSAGAVGISAVFGTTWQAADCERRMYAQQLRLAGNNKAALALLAMNPEVNQALRTAGYDGPLPAIAGATPPATLTPVQAQAHAAATPGGDQHPACAPSSWATKEWRAANCR